MIGIVSSIRLISEGSDRAPRVSSSDADFECTEIGLESRLLRFDTCLEPPKLFTALLFLSP